MQDVSHTVQLVYIPCKCSTLLGVCDSTLTPFRKWQAQRVIPKTKQQQSNYRVRKQTKKPEQDAQESPQEVTQKAQRDAQEAIEKAQKDAQEAIWKAEERARTMTALVIRLVLEPNSDQMQALERKIKQHYGRSDKSSLININCKQVVTCTRCLYSLRYSCTALQQHASDSSYVHGKLQLASNNSHGLCKHVCRSFEPLCRLLPTAPQALPDRADECESRAVRCL